MPMDERTYTLRELAQEVGVRPRTLHYYMEKGLLPKGGQRGPGARYPESYLHRLRFIQEGRAQERLTLDEIAVLLNVLPEETIAAVATGREPLDVMKLPWRVGPQSPPAPAKIAGIVSHVHETSRAPYHPAPSTPDAADKWFDAVRQMASRVDTSSEAGLRDFWMAGARRELPHAEQNVQRLMRRVEEVSGGTAGPERWITQAVTKNIAVSVRGLNRADERLLDALAAALRGLLEGK
jgi:DNA-binding transcriptional MerR regulator